MSIPVYRPTAAARIAALSQNLGGDSDNSDNDNSSSAHGSMQRCIVIIYNIMVMWNRN